MVHHRAAWLIGLLSLALVACSEKTPTPEEGAQTTAEGAGEAAPAEGAAKGAEEGAAKGAEEGAEEADPAAKAPPAKAPAPMAPPGTPPRIASVVSAQHTIAIAGVEGLAVAAREAAGSMDMIQGSVPDVPPDANPERWSEQLGFDPRTDAGWQAIGLDQAAGVALVVDSRVRLANDSKDPAPIVLFKVTDRAKLLALIEKQGGKITVGPAGPDGISEVTGPAGFALIGERQGWTAALFDVPEDERAPLRPQFAAWLKAKDDTLGASQKLAPSLMMPGEARLFGLVNTDAIARILPNDIGLSPEAQFYVNRFPAVSMAFSFVDARGMLRVQADGQGVRGLRQILVPEKPPVKAARFAPESAVGLGLSINLRQIFDGIQTLIPPNRGDIAGQVLLARNGLPMATGLSFEDLSQALTGHVVAMANPGELARPSAQPNVLLVAGLSDASALDRTLTFLFNHLGKQDPTSKVEKTQIGGKAGYILTVAGGPPGFLAVLDDAVLLGTRRDALEAAIKKEGGAASEQLAALDARGFFRMAVPMDSVQAALGNAPPDMKAAMKAGTDFWRAKLGASVSPAIVVDDHGVVADGPASVALVGVGAAIAIPAFMKYIKRAKEAEARINVQTIYTGALMAAMEAGGPGGIPATAPVTPAEDPCKAGEDHYLATAETFAHPTWKAVKFQPTGKTFYRYGFEKTADGFVVRAIGDLDCDGVASTYEMRATPAPDGGGFVGTPNDINPLE